jgi:hypothetical protein
LLLIGFPSYCNAEIPNESIIEFKQYKIITDTYEEYYEGERVYSAWILKSGFIIFSKDTIIMYEEYFVDTISDKRIEYVLRYYYSDGKCITNNEIIFTNSNIIIVDNNMCIISIKNEINDNVEIRFRINIE